MNYLNKGKFTYADKESSPLVLLLLEPALLLRLPRHLLLTLVSLLVEL